MNQYASELLQWSQPGISSSDPNYFNYFLLGLAGTIPIYFFPFLTALMRGKNPGGVFIVNLILGWTVIGWCIALIMACGQKPPRAPRRAPAQDRMTAREFIDESRWYWRERRAARLNGGPERR